MTLFSNLPGDEGLSGHERARVLAAVMTTTLMGVFDGTMINIALPSMASAMQVPANVAVWFANGYLLSAARTRARSCPDKPSSPGRFENSVIVVTPDKNSNDETIIIRYTGRKTQHLHLIVAYNALSEDSS
ncbi:hypothetical protein A3N51_15405 [Enterobacter kobei]|nr:hypothetical protein A3N51_15405 [Enterobacter kobei]